MGISKTPTFIQPPTGNTGDIYMKDTPCDNGEEVNPDSGPMWVSRDIWVRHDQDGGLEHQNPEYKVNSPNYVYIRVRSRGCAELTGANLKVYFSKASTGLEWPLTWQDYYLTGPNGQVLAGDEITTTPVAIPGIKSGEEWIVSIPWYPPNPAGFGNTDHHFCLLARIESSNDLMYITEGTNVESNTRNNNNIAWKNVSVFDLDPNNIIQGPVSVYIDCQPTFGNGALEVHSARHTLDRSIHDFGTVYIELQEPLKSQWLNNGGQGEGFTIMQDGSFRINDESFRLEGLPLDNCVNRVADVYFEPNSGAGDCAFDLIQFDELGGLVGGERFEYPGGDGVEERSIKAEKTKPTSGKFLLFPNPTGEILTLYLSKGLTNRLTITIHEIDGKLVATKEFFSAEKGNVEIAVAGLVPGVYFVQITTEDGISEVLKFIKQ